MNGIASLPYEVQDAPMVPLEGVGKIKNATDLLAQFGREGDTYIVHAAEGETVLPLEVLNSNPKMKNMIYKQMEELGLDPERYIVGNKLNSINPVTGAPEFFFKRIFRSIKKLVKKVAPIVLPVAAPFLFPMMPVALAAGLGSFAGNLIGGSDIKSSFKKALFSAALAGVGNVAFGNLAKGASNPFGSNFGQGFGSGSFFGSSVNPTAGFGDFSFSDAFTPSFSSNFAGASNAYRNRTMTDPNVALGTPTPNNQGGQIQPNNAAGSQGNTLDMADIGNNLSAGNETGAAIGDPLNQLGKVDSSPNIFEKYVYNPAPNTGVNVAPDGALLPQRQGEGYLESIFSPNRSSINPFSPDNLAQAGQDAAAVTENIAKLADAGASPELIGNLTDAATTNVYANALQTPSTYTKYLPLAAAGTAVAGGGAYAAGMFDTPTPGPDNDGDGVPDYWTTGQDLWQRDPSKYGFGTDNFYGNNPYYQDSGFMPTVPVTVAGGGHISGAGTATSDSIPAMLSDGEFVMNAKAVRGAGGGDREKGARKMYAMMRSLENRMT